MLHKGKPQQPKKVVLRLDPRTGLIQGDQSLQGVQIHQQPQVVSVDPVTGIVQQNIVETQQFVEETPIDSLQTLTTDGIANVEEEVREEVAEYHPSFEEIVEEQVYTQ